VTTPRTDDIGRAETDDRDLYEHAPCAYLSTRPDGTIVRGNATFFDWIGTAPEEIVEKRRFQSLLTMGSRIYYETHYSPLLQMQGVVNEIALEIRRSDDTVRPVVASARQVRGPDGSVTFNRIALFDSTDRRLYEHEILKARQRAEVAARALEQADRRKTEFIATVAHEMRNPLAPIRNALELIKRSNNPQLAVHTLDMMHRQVGQLTRLVEDLFDISRIGQDKLTLRLGPVDLSSVVQHAAEMSGPLLESAGVAYTADLPASPVYARGDAARLAQVVGNLLNNASKFTPAGGCVCLTLSREGDEAIIRVRDSGIGLDSAQLSHVFDMFMQVAAPGDTGTGLGIGLTLAKALMERHGGRISAHSEGRGLGAEFMLALPVLADAPLAVERTLDQSAPAKATPRRVLVVDDNVDASSMLAMLLSFEGHDTREAHDGLEAVRIAAEFEPDVVLMDIGLPVLNGYESAARIKVEMRRPPVLVALTGWGQEEDRRKAKAAGFDAHLVKPVDHDALTKLISDIQSRT
jgi:signal transduction histidine kinase/ActR/RegA family two-component response regulator